MKLSEEDKKLLAGVYGDVAQEAMEYQLEVARYSGAEEMVSISQASAGMDFALNGPYGLQRTEELAARGARFRCFTKMGLLAMDPYRWEELGSPEDVVDLQWRYHDAYLRMGAVPTYSNLPFLMPELGEQVAWPGSNTTVMANSFFGARTNMEGPIGSLMSALTARVPKVGTRLRENRRGTALVECRVSMTHSTDWDALGYAIGKQLPASTDVPVLTGMPAIDSMGKRMRFDSNITVPSSLQMYHIPGRTPEARSIEEAFQGMPCDRTITITEQDISDAYAAFANDDEDVDLVTFGGHHIELDDFPEIIGLLAGKKVKEGTRLWIFTGPQYKNLIEALGYDKEIARAGGELIYGTSLMLMTPRHFVENFGIRNVVCDSIKSAKYVRQFGMNSTFRTVEDCIAAAVTGKQGQQSNDRGRS